MHARLIAASLLSSACGYVAPLDTGVGDVLNVIEGTVVLGTDGPTADVMVLLYDANGSPPPPEGQGTPISIATIPASAFTSASGGILSAPYSLTQVPDGDFWVTAVLDRDADFNPSIDAAGGATCGDVGGAYLTDLVTQEFATLSVEGGALIQEVTVFLASEYTVERPSFAFAGGPPAVSMDNFLGGSLDFTLESVSVRSEILELDGYGVSELDPTCATGFLVNVVDEDGDGQADDHWLLDQIDPSDLSADQAPLFNALAPLAKKAWPRVFLVFEGDEETPLEPGEFYAVEAIHDDDIIAEEWPVNTPFPLGQVTLSFIPAGQHVFPDGSEELVFTSDLPTGAYSVVVMQLTGQTWEVPNDLVEFDVTDPSLFAVDRQAEALTWTSPPAE